MTAGDLKPNYRESNTRKFGAICILVGLLLIVYKSNRKALHIGTTPGKFYWLVGLVMGVVYIGLM
jgi:hypothetical protein